MLIAFMSMACLSCKKENPEAYKKYQESYATWLAFKEDSGNSYIYTVSWASWTELTLKTTITVSNGKVVKRAFQMNVPEGWDREIPEEEKSWTENEQEIGMHTNSAAADAVTFDKIYESARELIKKDRKATFETKNRGLISLFGIALPDCVDDCFQGTHIESIKALRDE